MPEHVDFELFIAVWLSILFPFILAGIALFVVFIFLRRLYRHYRQPFSAREREHRRWEIRRLKEWIKTRKEVLDRGAASLGIITEGEGSDEWMALREERYACDERLTELEGRLAELLREEEAGLREDLEGGRRTE